MKITKSIGKFISNETTLKILVVTLAIVSIAYINYIEYHRAVNDVVTLIQSDNYDTSFLAESPQ